MKENKYDDNTFFEQYSQMDRSVKGLSAAGEWHALKKMLPDFSGKRVLDLGCGFGWHCIYAAEHGACFVLGTDISEKMLKEARSKSTSSVIEYQQVAIEDLVLEPASFDIVLSSLAFHYIEDFNAICSKVGALLAPGGHFVFSLEHPVFTAYGSQDWHRDATGTIAHWPVDRYFIQGERDAIFLGEPVKKYHRTLTSLVTSLLNNGFEIKGLCEPQPDPALLDTVPGMRDELRRPMMLILSAVKK